ncbi:MAG: hypothetical protein DRJ62_03190 [Thermoprotei archaeon]|nr:MAG: hypothetical protein DRJ62_03190 [Thermoprotei archaeon]
MKVERRGCSLTWTIGVSSRGIYTATLTFYGGSGSWRVKRIIKLRPKRSMEERVLFTEDYSLPEFQCLLESCYSIISSLAVDEREACLSLALRASSLVSQLVAELRCMVDERG